MGVCVGDLEQRQMERLRVELGEVLAAHVAYPPFFNYRAAQSTVRPLDRIKRDEINQYLRSINFTPIERIEVASPEVRRFLERLILRYIEVNPSLARPRLYRRLPELRSRAPRMAAEVQRGLLAFLAGQATTFGTQRARPTWSGPAAQPHHLKQDREHNTRVLEAILVRRDSGVLPPLPTVRSATPAVATDALPPPTSAARLWPTTATDLTVPVPAQGIPSPGPQSPFAGLEVGAQSDVFGSVSSAGTISAPGAARSSAADDFISDSPTGPLVVPPISGGAPPTAGTPPSPANARELPPDLFQLYGDYLRDMEPEASDDVAPDLSNHPAPPHSIEHAAVAGAAGPIPANGYIGQAASEAMAQARSTGEIASTRSDKLIFWQLRYQLEAYVRRASRSYGVHTSSGDPSGVIDALRRSGFVDEADLRIAEGILALTDRVTAGVAPTIEDYRQALMLYLLYHRSHLGT
jgi:hypothetical protein